MAVFSHWKTKGEFLRYKRHLSDKLELEARQMQETNIDKARLASENESLRMHVARLNEKPDNKLTPDEHPAHSAGGRAHRQREFLTIPRRVVTTRSP